MRARINLPEALFLGIGFALTAALVLRAGMQGITGQAILLLAGYFFMVIRSEPGSRCRLLANYLAAWVLYAGSSAVVEALQVPLQHTALMAWDEMIFGRSPAVMIQGKLMPWMNDLLSLGYLSYHVYLHWAVVEAFFKSAAWRRDFSRVAFTAFGLGFTGYYLCPAAPPLQAFAAMFHSAIAGNWPTHFNEAVNTSLAARYDAFPSLHLLVTLALMTWDWRGQRCRFWIMLVPSVLMVVATLALRLHYAVDLLVSLMLYGLLLLLVKLPQSISHERTL
ncbi:hypothetical protein BH11VER1_BH11VER1_26980 [soil metagenome]